MELREKLATLESAVPPSDPGATGELHGVSVSGSGEGASVTVSKESSGHGGGKHVTFVEPEGASHSSGGQTESLPSTGDSAGGEVSGDRDHTEPASTIWRYISIIIQ